MVVILLASSGLSEERIRWNLSMPRLNCLLHAARALKGEDLMPYAEQEDDIQHLSETRQRWQAWRNANQ